MEQGRSGDIFLTVVFPAYNEADRLPASLRKTISYLRTRDFTWEIVVADDGSTDTTAEDALTVFAQENAPGRVVRLGRNMGKGAAVRQGLRVARGRVAAFSDADLAAPIEDLDKLLALLEQGCDIAIGSRALPGSNLVRRQTRLRETAGRIFNLMVQFFVFKGIRDTQCGFKAFRAQALPPLLDNQKISGFAFDVELLWLARKFGMSVCEAPVNWRHVEASKVGMFSDSARMFADLLRIRWMHRRTKPPANPQDGN